MTKGRIGMNAGTVLNVITTHDGSLVSFNMLKEKTTLSDADLWSAIGWLARENKIEIRKKTNDYPDFLPGTNLYY